jgi:HK97 family phage portal protein
MLPEITSRVKSLFAGFDAPPISIKSMIGADWYTRNGFYRLAELAQSATPSWSGEPVSRATALNHPVVFTCNRIIAETEGALPLPMMQQKGNDKVEAVQHPMFSALQHAPNDEMSAQRFRETITGHIVLGGMGYAQIFRRSGTNVAHELQMLVPEQVMPDRERTGQKRLVYVVKDGNSASKTYTVERNKPHDILCIPGIGWDGLRGYSVLTLGRQSFGTALAAEHHVGSFYRNGGRVPYVLMKEGRWATKEDGEKFRNDWEEMARQPHRAPILESPIKEYKQTGISMVDAQMLESRQFSVAEICRWFRISPHMAGDLSNVNNSISEQLALEFLTFTEQPWLKRWEQELWRCVLTPEEKSQGYFWRHNVNALLRGDFATRMAGYSTALQNGFMSQNEVRDLEDWNGFDGGDDYHIQLNMQTLPGGTPTASQAAALQKIGSAKKAWRVA